MSFFKKVKEIQDKVTEISENTLSELENKGIQSTGLFGKKCVKCGNRSRDLNDNGLCLKCEIEQLRQAVKPEYNNLEYINTQIQEKTNMLNQLQTKYESETKKLNNSIDNAKIELAVLNNEIEEKKEEIFTLDDNILLQEFGLYEPVYDFATSEEYKDELDKIREKQKLMVKEKTAATCEREWTVDGSRAKGRQMTNNNIKQILRTFNNECDSLIQKVKFNNIDKIEQRIEKSYEQLNKMNSSNEISLSKKYKNLKLQELNLAYEYQQKKQQEKEEERERRAEIREQKQLEQEIKRAREKILKEKKQFNNAIKEAEQRLKNANNETEIEELRNKIAELNNKIKEIDKEEKVIDYREKSPKAGYVYIISNIGAFGENVYKIGMTRRLEPMERVRELGDASVPFPFDVHALIFSEDAPSLESKLHKHFYNNRVNKTNNRKEFYNVPLNDIENIVKENYDKVIEFNKLHEAQEYRESLKIKTPVEELN